MIKFLPLINTLFFLSSFLTTNGQNPTVTINQSAAQTDPTNNSPIMFTVVFDQPVIGFTTGDVALSGTAGALIAVVTGGPTIYNITVAGMTTCGTVIANIPAGVCTNTLTQPNLASTSIDNTVTYAPLLPNPNVTINQAASQPDPTSASPINFTVLFDQPVTGFTTGDVTLSGTAGPTTGIVTGNGTSYNVAVSGMTASGTIIATIAAGVAQSACPQLNNASTSTDNTVTITCVPPVVSITPAVSCGGVAGIYGTALVATWAGPQVPGSVTVNSGILNLAVPDNTANGVSNNIILTGVPVNATITNLSVTLNMSHTYPGDMIFNLRAPNGQILNLYKYNNGLFTGPVSGNATWGWYGATVSQNGTNAWSTVAVAPYIYNNGTAWRADLINNPVINRVIQNPTGFVSNATSFGSLYPTGASANGIWTLAMADGGMPGDIGILASWSITIDYTVSAGPPHTFIWSPIPGLFTNPSVTAPYTGTNTPIVYAAPTVPVIYSVTGTNTVTGCSHTATAQVNNTPPAPVVTPSSVNMCLGAPAVKLYVSAGGIPARPAVWSPIAGLFFDAATAIPYNGSERDTVWVRPTPAGVYTYQVTTQAIPPSNCTSPPRSVVVTVGQPTMITQQPTNQNICMGASAVFSATAAGAGPLAYQWQVSTNGGGTYNNLVNLPPNGGVNTNTLTISTPPVAMSGYLFRVAVSGGPGCANALSSAAMLTVNPLPTIAITANPLIIGPTQTTTIFSTVTPNPAATYTWYYNSSVLPGAVSSSLLVNYGSPGDYQLKVTDINGCTSLSNIITIANSFTLNMLSYPNPSGGIFQIIYLHDPNNTTNNTLQRTLTVYNNWGGKIMTRVFPQTNNYQKIDVDIRQYGKGFYWVELKDANGKRLGMNRVVVQ